MLLCSALCAGGRQHGDSVSLQLHLIRGFLRVRSEMAKRDPGGRAPVPGGGPPAGPGSIIRGPAPHRVNCQFLRARVSVSTGGRRRPKAYTFANAALNFDNCVKTRRLRAGPRGVTLFFDERRLNFWQFTAASALVVCCDQQQRRMRLLQRLCAGRPRPRLTCGSAPRAGHRQRRRQRTLHGERQLTNARRPARVRSMRTMAGPAAGRAHRHRKRGVTCC